MVLLSCQRGFDPLVGDTTGTSGLAQWSLEPVRRRGPATKMEKKLSKAELRRAKFLEQKRKKEAIRAELLASLAYALAPHLHGAPASTVGACLHVWLLGWGRW